MADITEQWIHSLSVNSDYKTMHIYAGDGDGSRQFEINFSGGYINKSDVKAFMVHNATQERTDLVVNFIGTNTVTLSRAVPTTHRVTIYRDTNKVEPLAKFVDGAIITAKNLDRNAKQAVFGVAEMVDRFDVTVATASESIAVAYNALLNSQSALEIANGTYAAAGAAEQAARDSADSARVSADASELAVTVAYGIDGKAQTALDNSENALTIATNAGTVANSIDSKAQTALDNSEEAVAATEGSIRVVGTSLTPIGYETSRSGMSVKFDSSGDIQLYDPNELEADLYNYAASKGADLVRTVVDGIGAVPRTLRDKVGDYLTVFDFGAVGDGIADDTAALQHAIDAGSMLGKPVRLLSGTFIISSTIHIYANSVILGDGVTQTVIKVRDGANVGALETYNFNTLVGTGAKYVTDMDMPWGFVVKDITVDGNRQNNYGGVTETLLGGVGATVWDGFGIRLYGRRYILENINIRFCAGIGFYSECGSPTESPPKWYYNPLNNQYGHIHNLCVSDCSYEGFIFNGPGDIQIDNVTTELCNYPDESLYGTPRNSLMFPTQTIDGMVFTTTNVNLATGGCELGFIHSHTHKNGYGIRLFGDSNVPLRIRGDNITSEGSLSGVKLHGRVRGQLNKVNIRNLSIGDGSLPDFDYINDADETFTLSEYENIGKTGNSGSIRLNIQSNGLQVGQLTFKGYTAGHGVVIGSNVRNVIIDQLRCTALRGTAYDGNTSRAIWFKSGSSYNYISKAVLTGNSVGWYTESSGENIIVTGLIEYDSSVGSGIVLASTPSITTLKRCGITVRDSNTATSKFSTFSGAVSIDPKATTEQLLSVTHNMWRAPEQHEVSVSYTTNGSTRPTMAYMEVYSVTASHVNIRIRFNTAGNGTTSGSVVFVKV